MYRLVLMGVEDNFQKQLKNEKKKSIFLKNLIIFLNRSALYRLLGVLSEQSKRRADMSSLVRFRFKLDIKFNNSELGIKNFGAQKICIFS